MPTYRDASMLTEAIRDKVSANRLRPCDTSPEFRNEFAALTLGLDQALPSDLAAAYDSLSRQFPNALNEAIRKDHRKWGPTPWTRRRRTA